MTTCLVRHFSDLGFKKVVDEGGDEEREHDEVYGAVDAQKGAV